MDLQTPGGFMDNHKYHPRYQMISAMFADYLDEVSEGNKTRWDDWCDAHYKDYLEELVEAEQDEDRVVYPSRIQPWDWKSLGL